MSTANEKLAGALEELRALQQGGARVFASSELSRTARERLVKHGFLQEIMRGWLMSASPRALPGDTTPWYASFWEFCQRYGRELFDEDWYLSPEQSLLLHAENTTIPKQVILHSPRAHNNRIELLFGMSFFALKSKAAAAEDLEVRQGLRVYRVAEALTRVSEDFFVQYPVETQVLVSGMRDPSPLLARLLAGKHATIAGRLAGVFRNGGQPAIADEIVATMKAADHDIRELTPLGGIAVATPPSTPPLVARIQALWAASRDAVLAEMPPAPGRPRAPARYLQAIDDIYQLDAYHSLSIEGYQVTPALIERVTAGTWDPDGISSDRESLHALAARGYWLAFQRVRATVQRLLVAKPPIEVLRAAHREWFRELFAPHVAAGVLAAPVLAGYRNMPVYIRGSRHVPPRWEALPEATHALFDLVEQEPEPAVRAVLAHWLLGYIHPFPDGNGRVARFVMNALLAAGGYPWTVIRVDERDAYLAALETASVEGNLQPFARFIASQMKRGARPTARTAR